jgi:diguanylate cyclase (GGDEF)-like protein
LNDTYGHVAGDDILRHAARRLRSALRVYDSIGRYGGEEFLMVLPDCDTDVAVTVAERARVAVATGVQVAGAEVPLRVSLGVAATRTPDDPDHLIAAADAALYRAKAAGRNRVSS